MLYTIFLHFIDSSFAYFSAGSIDDAFECEIVVWVAKGAEVSDDVFYFFSIEKFESAKNLVGNSLLDEHLFEDLGLTIHPVEDGKISPIGSFV